MDYSTDGRVLMKARWFTPVARQNSKKVASQRKNPREKYVETLRARRRQRRCRFVPSMHYILSSL